MFVLIIISVISIGHTPIVTMQEFSSEGLCKEAMTYVKTNVPIPENITTTCVRK